MKKFLLLGIVLVIAVVSLPYVVPQTEPASTIWLKTSSISLYSKQIHAQTLQACFAFGEGGWSEGPFDPTSASDWWGQAVQQMAGQAEQNAQCSTWPSTCPSNPNQGPTNPFSPTLPYA